MAFLFYSESVNQTIREVLTQVVTNITLLRHIIKLVHFKD